MQEVPYITIISYVGVSVSFLLLGFFISFLYKTSNKDRLIAQYKDEVHYGETAFREMIETISRLKTENKILANFFVCLPEFAKEINTNLDRRNIPPLLLKLIDQMFSPEQIHIFFADQSHKRLSLVESKGITKGNRNKYSIEMGKGEIGWVAQNQIVMSSTDFQNESRYQNPQHRDTHYDLKSDLIAPMLHQNETLGVISIAGLPKSRPKEEKMMLKMIADLGSIALFNAKLFNSIQISANHDGLTKLMNKKYFMQRLGFEINKAEKDNTPISIFIFDLDDFKSYNDSNGHLAGDEALKIIGRLLNETVREDDFVARYGGEEFILALPNTPKKGALVVAEKIRKMFEGYHFPNQETLPMGGMTISGGISSFPSDGRSSTDLINHADQALYQAKAKGKNSIVTYEPIYFGDKESEKYYR
jgi:diguanylate cyclase (GGDEF)-like protein